MRSVKSCSDINPPTAGPQVSSAEFIKGLKPGSVFWLPGNPDSTYIKLNCTCYSTLPCVTSIGGYTFHLNQFYSAVNIYTELKNAVLVRNENTN